MQPEGEKREMLLSSGERQGVGETTAVRFQVLRYEDWDN